jgi:hypothetical protein
LVQRRRMECSRHGQVRLPPNKHMQLTGCIGRL